MSFADELRTASNVNTSELRRERDFEDFVKIFYDYVKDDCEYYASKGEDSCKIRYDTFIKDCEKNHQWEKWYYYAFYLCEIGLYEHYVSANDRNADWYGDFDNYMNYYSDTDHFFEKDDTYDSEKSEYYHVFSHYIGLNGIRTLRKNQYTKVICEKIVDKFVEKVNTLIENDGFKEIKWEKYPEVELYHEENTEWVEKKTGIIALEYLAHAAFSEDTDSIQKGYYRKKQVQDGFLYLPMLTLKW